MPPLPVAKECTATGLPGYTECPYRTMEKHGPHNVPNSGPTQSLRHPEPASRPGPYGRVLTPTPHWRLPAPVPGTPRKRTQLPGHGRLDGPRSFRNAPLRLRYWLSTRTHLRPTSLLHYTRDVEQVPIPWLGALTAVHLDPALLRAKFAEIAQTTNRRGQPQSASAMQHLRTTLCAALNLAVREGLIESNPAKHIEIRGYQRPHAHVWTDDRVADWQATGIRPAVAVWTVEHLATFLTAVTEDRLYALWWLIGLRGLRRSGRCRW